MNSHLETAGADAPAEDSRIGELRSAAPGSRGRTAPRRKPLLAGFIRVAVFILGWMPLRLVHFAGAALGRIASWLPIAERRITDINLEIAFPDLSRSQRNRLRRRSLEHTGRTFFEMGFILTRPPEQVTGLVAEIVGADRVDEALASGRGVLFFGPPPRSLGDPPRPPLDAAIR